MQIEPKYVFVRLALHCACVGALGTAATYRWWWALWWRSRTPRRISTACRPYGAPSSVLRSPSPGSLPPICYISWLPFFRVLQWPNTRATVFRSVDDKNCFFSGIWCYRNGQSVRDVSKESIFFETSGSGYLLMQRHIPEERKRQLHCCYNLITCIKDILQ